MAVSEEGDRVKDSRFNASRVPITCRSQALVKEVCEQLLDYERQFHPRVRARRAADQARFERIVSALICDLCHAALATPGSWRHISLSKRRHGRDSVGAAFMTGARIQIIERLSQPALGWLELDKGDQFRNPFGGRQSRIRAGARLLRRMDELAIHFDDLGRDPELMGDPIVLRAPKVRGRAKNLPVPLGEPAGTYREELLRINRWLAEANIVSHESDEEGRYRDDGERWLRRIFNDGRLDRGGRLYGGFWQGMSEAYRLQSITIDDEPVVSLDFGQCAIHIAYAQVGAIPPEGDLYLIPGLEPYREGVKKVMGACLHCLKPITRFPQGARSNFPRWLTIQGVLAAIASRHRPIQALFHSGFGLAGFFAESQVLVLSLLRLMDLKVVALPVHDCLLVPLSAVPLAREVMRSSFKEVTAAKVDIDVDGAVWDYSTRSTVPWLGKADCDATVPAMLGRDKPTTVTT